MNHSKKRILIVEDDEEMRSLLKDFVDEDGCLTDFVENGSEAFRKVANQTFDLVITDIRMPGLSGLDILPGLRKLLPQAFIIVITAFGGEEVRRKAIERGATAYLEKPLQLNQLRTLIHEMILNGKGKKLSNGLHFDHLP
jgi:two-component system response regulator AtoC